VQLADEQALAALENFADAPAAQPAASVGVEVDEHAVAVHGGSERPGRERDRRTAVVGEDHGATAAPGLHATGHAAEALGKRHAALAGADDLAARFEIGERRFYIAGAGVDALGETVDEEVLALDPMERCKDALRELAGGVALVTAPGGQTNTGGWNSPKCSRMASEISPSEA
jgi:hypothetical protein